MGSSPIPDPTQDPDFMKASPSDQMAYLRDTDPDFAKASPQDQFGYLLHLRGADNAGIQGPQKPPIPEELRTKMSTSGLSLPAVSPSMNPKLMEALPGAQMSPRVGSAIIGAAGAEAGALGTQAAGAGIAAGARAITPAVQAAGNWAEANPGWAKLLLEAARTTGLGAAVYKGLKRVTK